MGGYVPLVDPRMLRPCRRWNLGNPTWRLCWTSFDSDYQPHQKKSNCTTKKTSCITKKRHWHKQNKQLHKKKSSGSWWSSHSRAECGRPGPLAATRLEIIRTYSLGRGSMGSVQEPTPRQVQQLEFNKHLTVALKIGLNKGLPSGCLT